MTSEITKVCITCKIEKSVFDFYENHQKLMSSCKDCTKDKVRQYRKENLEKVRQLTRDRYRDRPNYYMYHAAKKRAKEKGIPFDITVDDVVIPKYCPILNIELNRSKVNIAPNSPTLDRIIPEKGYVKGNIQVISNKANIMKSDASEVELILFAEWVLLSYSDRTEDSTNMT